MSFPKKKWRVLILLNPSGELGRAWQLGLALARANNGQLIVVALATGDNGETVAACQSTLTAAQGVCPPDWDMTALLVSGPDATQTLVDLTREAEIDLLLAHVDSEMRYDLNRIPCVVIALRGDREEVVGITAVSRQPTAN